MEQIFREHGKRVFLRQDIFIPLFLHPVSSCLASFTDPQAVVKQYIYLQAQ